MRIAFAVLVAIHGLIHLLGFVKGLELAPIPQLTLPVSRNVGLLWLVATLLVCAAALLFVLRIEWWWTVGVSGALLSQGLVFASWGDAKAGTIANILLVIGALLGLADQRFSRATDALSEDLLRTAAALPRAGAPRVDPGLPPALRDWLTRSGALERPAPRAVRLQQRGQMQLEPGGGFRDVVAHQYFRIDEPAFLWRVRLAMMGVPIVGRDTWIQGRGRMRIELAALIPIVDEASPRIDQGALLRYLGETVWFPAAALSPHITWAPGQDPAHQAVATMRVGEVEASADFTFDDQGRFASMHAQRYRGGGADATLTPWTVRATGWSRVGPAGVEIPSRGEVIWHLPEGEFVFYRFEVTAIEYDAFTVYSAP